MAGRKEYTSHKSGESVSRQATHFTKRLAEMDYTVHRQEIVALARGKYEGYPFIVLSLGTHPTAYVCLPKGHPYFGKDYDFPDIDVHGGFTYANNEVAKSTIKDRWWLGWDYAHVGDYMGYYSPGGPLDEFYEKHGHDKDKRWTRDEIVEHAKDVIRQLKAVENK